MLGILFIFLTALATGIFFFAGLHYSVGKIVRSRYAAVWAAGSFLIRTGITLGVFYWLAAGSIGRLLVCTGAFLMAKALVMWWTGRLSMGGPGTGRLGTSRATQRRQPCD